MPKVLLPVRTITDIGKPEHLKHQDGYSRRINDEHRLIYNVTEENVIAVKSCKGHYDDK